MHGIIELVHEFIFCDTFLYVCFNVFHRTRELKVYSTVTNTCTFYNLIISDPRQDPGDDMIILSADKQPLYTWGPQEAGFCAHEHN